MRRSVLVAAIYIVLSTVAGTLLNTYDLINSPSWLNVIAGGAILTTLFVIVLHLFVILSEELDRRVDNLIEEIKKRKE